MSEGGELTINNGYYNLRVINFNKTDGERFNAKSSKILKPKTTYVRYITFIDEATNLDSEQITICKQCEYLEIIKTMYENSNSKKLMEYKNYEENDKIRKPYKRRLLMCIKCELTNDRKLQYINYIISVT